MIGFLRQKLLPPISISFSREDRVRGLTPRLVPGWSLLHPRKSPGFMPSAVPNSVAPPLPVCHRARRFPSSSHSAVPSPATAATADGARPCNPPRASNGAGPVQRPCGDAEDGDQGRGLLLRTCAKVRWPAYSGHRARPQVSHPLNPSPKATSCCMWLTLLWRDARLIRCIGVLNN
jgi:hypothetical protein